jgi:hypothetical protein
MHFTAMKIAIGNRASRRPRRRAVLWAELLAAALTAAVPVAAIGQAAVSVTPPDPHKTYNDPVTHSPIAGVNPGLPAPAFPTSNREVRTFTAQVVYNFAHYDYTPPVAVEQVSRAGGDLKTPEGAFIAVLSAMQQKDYEWFLSLWDKKSAADIRDGDLQQGGSETTRKQWQEMFVGRRVEIAERIESGLYVAIIFRVYQPGVAAPRLSTGMVFKNEGGHWEATNETEMTNAFVVLHQGQTSKQVLRGVLTPLVNGTGYLDSGEPNPEDVAQTEFLRQYPKGKTEVTHVMQ